MALISMTGFAEARGQHHALRWRWEVRSVNGRSLDIRLRVPSGFESLEAAARTLAAERFKRGSLQAVFSTSTDDSERGFRVDPTALANAVAIAKKLADETGLPPARVDGLLALRGIVVQEETLALDEEARMKRDAAILESLAAAFDQLAAARAAEGAKLEKILSSQIKEIEAGTAEARALAAAQPQALRDRMLAQLNDLLGPNSTVPPERLAQEVAMLATRGDSREELDRLTAHCQQARSLMAAAEPVGRKLDFLAQEFNREANTLCSKSADIALTRVGLALKAVIDQVREQVQNVE